MPYIFILLLAPLFLVVYLVFVFNSIVKLKNNREQAMSDIDVQLKNRYDLVPNLVNTVKGYATHEKAVLEEVTKARTQAMNASGIDEKIVAENEFAGTLRSLFAVAENYPDLKANENFLQLQNELSDLENKIAAARRFFNNTSKEFNTAIQMFPNNLIAAATGFKEGKFFDLGEEKAVASEAVKISI